LNFDGAEAVPMTMDPDIHLPKVQQPSTEADLAKIENLPYHEAFGFNTHALIGTNPDATFEAPTVAEFLENVGATYAEAVHCDFRGLGGTKDISWVNKDKRDHLPTYQDPGEAPQHTEVGYKPIMDEDSSLDQSKGTRDAISTMWMAEAERDEEVAGIHAADARRLFWETFPPAPGINKPPSGINKPTYQSRPYAYT
jgi:hypothetical protein